MMERSLNQSAVGQSAELRKPCQELGDLEGCRPHIPGGHIRGMDGTAKEAGHRVVGGVAIGAGGVIGPAYGMAGSSPKAALGSDGCAPH